MVFAVVVVGKTASPAHVVLPSCPCAAGASSLGGGGLAGHGDIEFDGRTFASASSGSGAWVTVAATPVWSNLPETIL